MILNEFNCDKKTWKKFDNKEKEMYNNLFRLMHWKHILPTKLHIKADDFDMEILAHNIAVTVIWNFKEIMK